MLRPAERARTPAAASRPANVPQSRHARRPSVWGPLYPRIREARDLVRVLPKQPLSHAHVGRCAPAAEPWARKGSRGTWGLGRSVAFSRVPD